MGNNVIEFIPGVTIESDCKYHCKNNFRCAFYTYYGQESPQFSNVCVLLTNFQPPLVKCQSCVTSLSDCKHGSNFCNLMDQEDSQQREGMYNKPMDCQWSPWSPYSVCSKTCDGGAKRRIRYKVVVESNGGVCKGSNENTVPCNNQKCPLQ